MESPHPVSMSSNLKWITVVLVVAGVTLLVLYRIGLRAEGTKDIIWFLKLAAGQAILYFVASWVILRARPARSLFLIVILFGVLFRLSILFSPPHLSDDIYRYVWDGRVQAARINPYRYIPADPSLAQLRDDKIYPKINRRDYAHTIYPPAAQAVYFLTTRISESVTWMKATMLAFEAVAIWALAQLLASFGFSRQRVLIYAWHPLIVWEFAGSGHVDAIAIAFIAVALTARRRNAEVVVGVALACATLVKFFPLALFPALYKRWSWKMPLALAITIVVAYLPYLSVGPISMLGFLPGYLTERGLASGEQFYLLSVARRCLAGASLPNAAFVIFALITMIGIAAWTLFRSEQHVYSYVKRACILATVAIVLLAPHFSWYFAWLIPFLCFVPLLSLFYLTAASFVLYGTWLGDTPEQVFWLNTAIYLPFALLAAVELLARPLRFRLTRQRLEDASARVVETTD
jgi:alpha-1,6-mannosyltransferase